MLRGSILLLASVVAAASPLTAHAARKPGLFKASLGVRVAKGAQAEVRAVDRATGLVAAARHVGRAGRFRLSLAPGVYLVVGTVVSPNGKVVQRRIGVSLKADQKRKRASLAAPRRKRKRKPRAQAAFVQERGEVTPGRIAVEIPNVTGSTGDPEWDALRGGINDLMINDVLVASRGCGTAVIEVERRAELIKELEFQQSPYVDPSTRRQRNFIIGDLELRGTITAAPGGGARVAMAIIELATGRSLGERDASLTRDGDWPAALENLAHGLADDVCNLSDIYEVSLEVDGEGRFATHSATGSIAVTLPARRGERGKNVWRATGPLQWGSVTFTPGTDCPLVDYVIPTISWSVTITDVGDGMLRTTWTRSGNEATTASVDCPPDGVGNPDPPPIPGQAGVALINTGPETFLVPYAGGEQPVSGVVEDDGDGFFNSGKITVRRAGIG